MEAHHHGVDLHDNTWLSDISQAVPQAAIQVLSTVCIDTQTVVTLRVSGVHHERVLGAIETDPRCSLVSVYRNQEEAVLHVATEESVLTSSERFPIVVRDGLANLEELTAADAPIERRRFTSVSDGPRTVPLTERQREVLRTALAQGYYDNPRECTLTELADELGIAKSTCSGILQRLESTVMHAIADPAGLPASGD